MQNIYIFWENHVPNVNRFNFVSLTLWVCVCVHVCVSVCLCVCVCMYACTHVCVKCAISNIDVFIVGPMVKVMVIFLQYPYLLV